METKQLVKTVVRANVIRANLARSLAQSLPSEIFFQPGFVHEYAVKKTRVRITWGAQSFWFDSDAVAIVEKIAA